MLDAVVGRYVEAVAAVVDEALGAATVGVYVHGSAARNDLDLATSDIDVLVVSAESLDTEEKHGLAARLSNAALPCPAAGGLELGIVTRESAATASKAPFFELDLSTRAGRGDRITDGAA
ncbi:MAG: nucleotidyltransferase domain-containing protein, partial [Actinomycetota bacterium]